MREVLGAFVGVNKVLRKPKHKLESPKAFPYTTAREAAAAFTAATAVFYSDSKTRVS